MRLSWPQSLRATVKVIGPERSPLAQDDNAAMICDMWILKKSWARREPRTRNLYPQVPEEPLNSETSLFGAVVMMY